MVRDGQFTEWLAQRSSVLSRRAVKSSMLAQAEDGPSAGVQGKQRILAKVWLTRILF